MKVVGIIGERQSQLMEEPDPHAHGELALVKIIAVPMCTEYKGFASGEQTCCLGHEAAGEVVEVTQPSRVKVGDRVVVMPLYACGQCPLCLKGDYIYCQHQLDFQKVTGQATGNVTYAQYLLKQDWLLVPIPDKVSYDHASMACCGLGPTFGAMQRMQADAFDTILIAGMGPVGLGGIINGLFRGLRVIAVESHPYRAKLALKLGATAVINPQEADPLGQIMDLTHGLGVDKFIDCTGVPAAQRLGIDAVRRRGQVAFVGEGGNLNIHVGNDMLRKGLTLHGSWHFNLGDVPRLMQVITKSAKLLDELITHKFAMEDIQRAFELQLTKNCGKVILYPWQKSGSLAT
ncbi:MAG: zinc-binding dehydrogenase [Verrucomicrobia bacterium]|nr:zinc-binding dehydrogenase [Verrucomicrobiota bacterium]MBU1736368.1 zinc-binding dehydrogenase [Verrucomicrobiota bacterium]MBU1858139.1 zinc-binding dehydrogenase [Verrucomicrobiota bacterium]